jgi:circadian clock protein KaiB
MTAHAGEPAPASEPGGARVGDGMYLLTLYVTGQSVRSQLAVTNLRGLCERLQGRCELTVVDVLERPQLAEDEKILATPTVVRKHPLPLRRVIGDLSDAEKVVLWLDLPGPGGETP